MKRLIVGMLTITSMSTAFAAETPVTMEILVGQATQSVTGNGTRLKDADDTSVAIRFGYEFADSWSAEAAYYDYGKASSSFIDEYGDKITDIMTSSAFLLGIKKEFNLNEKLSLNARAGIAFWDFDIKETDSSDPSNPFKASDSGNDLYLGAGLAYSVKDNLLLSINYSFLSMGATLKDIDGDAFKSDNDINIVSLGIGYQF
ncbi:outer membrane beta-barrel protein [Marinomonas sp. FW-1]|uniref:outer membrane beta-barrel protein n=1 Tax=Marinomonas sp. FW-1 TaxID=2071621 RepID=UPI001586F249|nr:outer membrane beta-barrel protein [Marinomonas sp. FW-1]